MKDPDAGYDPLLAARMRAVLPICVKNKVRIVTNMGAANPATQPPRRARKIARRLGLKVLKVAAITGDDVFAYLLDHDVALDNGKTVAALGNSVISANAYIGVAPIVEALNGGVADVVITSRAAQSGDFVVATNRRIWLADEQLDPAWSEHAGRAPARVRGPGHRRLFRRSRSEGHLRSRPARFPDWRGSRKTESSSSLQGYRFGRAR